MPTRIEKLANNSTMYYRGDSCLEISPFTNYYMFTIYRESNDESVDDHLPLNLTNLGTIWLSFINGSTKIRIPNYKEVEDIDMANGEVVFRISEEDASRILALTNNTFYVSSAITDGKTSSDETVLFSGSWSEYSLAMKAALTDTVTNLKDTVRSLEEKIAADTESWTNKLENAQTEIENLKSENDRLSAQIIELENKLAEIDSSYIDATIVSQTSSQSEDTNVMPREKVETGNIEEDASRLQVASLKSAFTTGDASQTRNTVSQRLSTSNSRL